MLNTELLFLLGYLVQQLSGLTKCLLHVIKAPEEGRDPEPYRLYAVTELADLVDYCDRLAEKLGCEFNQVRELGLARRVEKEADYKRRHKGAVWV